MIIRIEIDVKPEELRAFLGLPDVVGMQEDLIKYLRDKVTSSEGFDPSAFVRGNVQRGSRVWNKIMTGAFARAAERGDDAPAEADLAEEFEAEVETWIEEELQSSDLLDPTPEDGDEHESDDDASKHKR